MQVTDTVTGATNFTVGMSGDAQSTAHCTDSLLYIATPGGGIYVYNALSGHLLWGAGLTADPGSPFYYAMSSISALNQVLYVNYQYLFAKNVLTGATIWKTQLNDLDGVSESTPCIVTKSGKVFRGGNHF